MSMQMQDRTLLVHPVNPGTRKRKEHVKHGIEGSWAAQTRLSKMNTRLIFGEKGFAGSPADLAKGRHSVSWSFS